jgi:hypothetical protein
MLDPEQQEWWLTTLLMIVISVWAGFVSYLRTLVRGQAFSWLWFASHISSSALAGLVTVLLCDEYGASLQITGIACALSGHMSGEAVRIFEDKFREKVKEVA